MYTYVAWILGRISHTPVCKGNNRVNLFKLYVNMALSKLTIDSGNNGIEMGAVEQRCHMSRFQGLAHSKNTVEIPKTTGPCSSLHRRVLNLKNNKSHMGGRQPDA